MACGALSGKIQICAEALGGLKEVHLVNFADIEGTLTIAAGVVTDSSATFTSYRYKVRNSSGEKPGVTETTELGASAIFHKQVLELVIPEQTTADMLNYHSLAKGRVVAFTLDNNGDVRMYGRTRGLEMESGEISTGKEMGDFNGYKLTLSGEEEEPAYMLAALTTYPLDSLNAATITYNPAY